MGIPNKKRKDSKQDSEINNNEQVVKTRKSIISEGGDKNVSPKNRRSQAELLIEDNMESLFMKDISSTGGDDFFRLKRTRNNIKSHGQISMLDYESEISFSDKEESISSETSKKPSVTPPCKRVKLNCSGSRRSSTAMERSSRPRTSIADSPLAPSTGDPDLSSLARGGDQKSTPGRRKSRTKSKPASTTPVRDSPPASQSQRGSTTTAAPGGQRSRRKRSKVGSARLHSPLKGSPRLLNNKENKPTPYTPNATLYQRNTRCKIIADDGTIQECHIVEPSTIEEPNPIVCLTNGQVCSIPRDNLLRMLPPPFVPPPPVLPSYPPVPEAKHLGGLREPANKDNRQHVHRPRSRDEIEDVTTTTRGRGDTDVKFHGEQPATSMHPSPAPPATASAATIAATTTSTDASGVGSTSPTPASLVPRTPVSPAYAAKKHKMVAASTTTMAAMSYRCCIVCTRVAKTSNYLSACSLCGMYYHRNCHNGVPKNGRWFCKSCVHCKLMKIRSLASSGTLSKLEFPYKISTLQWNTTHTKNKENIYCYCSGPGIWYMKMLQCFTCSQWFHQACLQCLPRPLILGDRRMIFRCAVCNHGEEFIDRDNMQWFDVLHLALFNLHLVRGKINRFDTTIVDWLKEHLPYLLDREFKDSDIDKALNVLEENANLFYNGREQKKSKDLFSLRFISTPCPSTISLKKNGHAVTRIKDLNINYERSLEDIKENEFRCLKLPRNYLNEIDNLKWNALDVANMSGSFKREYIQDNDHPAINDPTRANYDGQIANLQLNVKKEMLQLTQKVSRVSDLENLRDYKSEKLVGKKPKKDVAELESDPRTESNIAAGRRTRSNSRQRPITPIADRSDNPTTLKPTPLMQKICRAVKEMQNNMRSTRANKSQLTRRGLSIKSATNKKSSTRMSNFPAASISPTPASTSDEELLSTFVSGNRASKVCKPEPRKTHSRSLPAIGGKSSPARHQPRPSPADLDGKQLLGLSKMIRNLDTTLLGTSVTSGHRRRRQSNPPPLPPPLSPSSSSSGHDRTNFGGRGASACRRELEEEDYPLASLRGSASSERGRTAKRSAVTTPSGAGNLAKRIKREIEEEEDDDCDVDQAIAASLAMMNRGQDHQSSSCAPSGMAAVVVCKRGRGRPRIKPLRTTPKGPRGRPRIHPSAPVIADCSLVVKKEVGDSNVSPPKPLPGRLRLKSTDHRTAQLNATAAAELKKTSTPTSSLVKAKSATKKTPDVGKKASRGRPKKSSSADIETVNVATPPASKPKRKPRKKNVFIDTGPPEDPSQVARERYRHEPVQANSPSLLDYDMALDPFNSFNQCKTNSMTEIYSKIASRMMSYNQESHEELTFEDLFLDKVDNDYPSRCDVLSEYDLKTTIAASRILSSGHHQIKILHKNGTLTQWIYVKPE